MKARRLIGSKTEVSVGDVVVQVEPPEEGILTVKTQQGEVGSLPLSCLGTTDRTDCQLQRFHSLSALKDKKWTVSVRHKLIGTKVWLEVGEEVTEVEPEEDGFVTVKKRSGEEGSVSVSALTSSTASHSSPEDKRYKIKSRQKLLGTKVVLEAGDTVTLLEEEEDGYVTVLTAAGDQGHVPVACLGKLLLSWLGRSEQVKSSALQSVKKR